MKYKYDFVSLDLFTPEMMVPFLCQLREVEGKGGRAGTELLTANSHYII